MKVAKWGNSLAIRLPADLIAQLELKEGDEVDVRKAADQALEVAKRPTADELLDRLHALRGLVPADYRFKRSDAYDED